jgi:hypothetical protein
MDVAWNHVLSSFGIGGLDSENQQRHTEGDDSRGARGEFRVDEGGSFYNPPQEFSPKLQGESNEHGQARNHTYSLSSPSPSRVTEEIHSLQTHRSVHGVHPIESNLLLWVAYRRCHDVCGEVDAEYVAEELKELEGALELACQQSIEVTGSAVDEEYVGESMMVCLGGYRALAKMLIEEQSQHGGPGGSGGVIGQGQGAAGTDIQQPGESALVPHHKPKVLVFEASKKLTASSPLVKKLLSSQQEGGVALKLQEERDIEPEWKGKLTTRDIKSMSDKDIQRLVDWRVMMAKRSENRKGQFTVDGRPVSRLVEKMLAVKPPEEAAILIRDMEAAKFGKLTSRFIREDVDDDGETAITGTSTVMSLRMADSNAKPATNQMMGNKPGHSTTKEQAPIVMTTSDGALVHRISSAMQRHLRVCVKSEGGRAVLCMPRQKVAEEIQRAGSKRSGASHARIANGKNDALASGLPLDSARSGQGNLRPIGSAPSGQGNLGTGRHLDLVQHLLEQQV